MRAYERLLEYVTYPTQSSLDTHTHPSNPAEFDLARRLAEDLRALGLADAWVDEHCYVYGHLPAAPGCEDAPALGLIAHMDTSDEAPGHGVKAMLHPAYNGGEIVMPATGEVMSVARFPELAKCVGETLITTDGSTLLGADDKAGVAEILTAVERLQAEGLPHGPICVAFTPDEEIGEGASFFDLEAFGAQFAFTVDGNDAGELEYENFNAASAVVYCRGLSVHPGTAKNTMINAQNLAMEFHRMLPAAERPEHTEQREGFYHLTSMAGTVSGAKLGYILRDHDRARFEARKQRMLDTADCLNRLYGEERVRVELRDTYYNMLEKIRPHLHLLEHARAAIRAAGMEPVEPPVRGGTDGALLSHMGLPCPNLGTGGFNFHGVFEFTTAERMDRATEVLVQLAVGYARGV